MDSYCLPLRRHIAVIEEVKLDQLESRFRRHVVAIEHVTPDRLDQVVIYKYIYIVRDYGLECRTEKIEENIIKRLGDVL